MRLPFDILTQNYVKPRLFLCETDKTKICQLETITLNGSFKFNSYSELNFTVGRTYTNMITGETDVNPFYDKIEALRLVLLEGFGYFEIQEPEIDSDGIREVKNVTAYSLEYRLSQKYLENFKINTGEADSLEVIKAGKSQVIPVRLTYHDKDLSLTDLVLEKVYDWEWGHIDPSLTTMSRQFDISRASVYDFIVQDLCEKFNCFATFDTLDPDNNKINLYAEALTTKHIGDGISNTFIVSPSYDSVGIVSIDSYKTTKYTYYVYRETTEKKGWIAFPGGLDKYTDMTREELNSFASSLGDAYSISDDGTQLLDSKGQIVDNTGYLVFYDTPQNGAKIEITDGSQKKWQTDVYVSFDNLAQEVKVNYSADDIKTVLTVKGADDLDIREVNMGLPYIVDISYYHTVDWMGQELYDAYTDYMKVCNESQTQYSKTAEEMLEIAGRIVYETQRLSLEYSIADHVTSTTVGTYYVQCGTEDTGYYYKEVKLPDEYNASVKNYYMLSGSDLDEDKFSKLYTALQEYYVSQTNRTVTSIKALADSFAFMKENTIESLSNTLSKSATASTIEQKDAAILAFLDEMWDQLGSTPLDSLYLQSYKKIESTYIESGWDESSITSTNGLKYHTVDLIIQSIESEIEARKLTIEQYQEQYKVLQDDNTELAQKTSIYNNFTHDQLIRLSPFLREDEYTDDNFVETDSDSIEQLMTTKQELLECGKIELKKLCEPKLAFSMDMANIYALAEFEPIVYQFQLGKLINVIIREDYIKRARLLAVDINFDDFSDFTCEFGELTNLKTQSSIHADLLANAINAGKSVASNQSYWDKGADLATSTDIKIQNGLLNAIDGIYNTDQSVLIDNHGIRLRRVLDDGTYAPEQIWMQNNTILVSTDSFETSQTGIGIFEIDGRKMYGVLAQAILSGYIESSTIVGGTIDIGGGTFTVDSNGHMVATSGSIAGWTINKNNLMKALTLDNTDYQMYLQAPNGDSMINAFAVRSKETGSDDWDTQFAVNYKGKMLAKNADVTGAITANSLTLGDNVAIPYSKLSGAPDLNIYIAKDGTVGKTPAEGSTGFKVSKSGLLEASNATIYGTIYSSAGKSAGWEIYSDYLGKEITIDDSDYHMYLQAPNGTSSTNAIVVRTKATGSNDWDYQFAVNYKGKLTAKNADVAGKITASSGAIGSWTIGDMEDYTDSIYSTYCAESTPSSSSPEYAVFMRGKGAENTIAIGIKQRTSITTDWTDADSPFYVRKDGYVKMANANVTGTVNAEDGTIGGWTIGKSKIYGTSDTGKVAVMQLPTENTTFVFAAGGSSHSGYSDCPFRVTKDGKLYASKGTIGGFEINDDRLICRQNNSDTNKSLSYMSFNAYSYDTDNHNAIIIGTRSSASDDYTTQFRVRYDGSVYMRNATITGDSTIASACIPNLNADKITAGTLDVDRIPNISASKITTGTLDTNRLSSSVITTGNFSSKSLTTGNLTVTGGATIGSWSVTSSGALTAVSGDVGVGLSAYGLSAGSNGSTPWVNILMAGQNASDQRLKKNIFELDNKLDNIFDSLKPVQFEYSTDNLGQGIHFGYLAQDVIKSFEGEDENIQDYSLVYEAATEDDPTEKYYQLNKAEFIALNTWQIQKLKARIEELEHKLSTLET